MCGIIALAKLRSKKSVISDIINGLCVLQHRGQDAAGIAWVDDDNTTVHIKKGLGLVREVFSNKKPFVASSRFGIGHVRYPTAGNYSADLAQPLTLKSAEGVEISLAHNGNLNNVAITNGLKHNISLSANSDSEIILNLFVDNLSKNINAQSIFNSIEQIGKSCTGAYAVVAIIAGVGVVAFRDKFGIRPLIMGVQETEYGKNYAFASESSSLTILGFEIERDVKAGEGIFIDMDGNMHSHICIEDACLTPCIFEHVYLARPDSTLDKIHMYKTRLRQGEFLAKKIMRSFNHKNIDVIIPIPDTSRVSAQAAAETMGIKLREGLIKNRYIGRTFIMPNQEERLHAVRYKLSVIQSEVKDKRVMLIDDSIVRGTTSKEIVHMIRAAGAKEVYLASAAPEVRYQSIYGIDMPCRKDFIAHNRTAEQIAKKLEADWLVYQDLKDLISASKIGNPSIQNFECSIFTGQYVTGQPSDDFFKNLSQARGNSTGKKYE